MPRLVCGNWKMNATEPEAARLTEEIVRLLPTGLGVPEVALAPPYTSLRAVADRIRGGAIVLAAQNMHWASHGAFTGEVSASMLAGLGVRYVIVGHSERRRLLRETNEEIGMKVAAAAEAGLLPILCVGEEEADRISGRTFEVIGAQLAAGTARLGRLHASALTIAYEPVWAIGTGRTASPGQAAEAHGAIRELLRQRADGDAGGIRILYGGSVTAESAPALFREEGIDGALVGGASLVPEAFAAIVRAA